jgi:hypothetical protein
MAADSSSVQAFIAAIPEPVIHLLDPHAQAASGHLREALGSAIASSLFVLCLYVVMRVVEGLRDLLSGRSQSVRPGGFFSFVRKLACVGVLALPLHNVLEIVDGAEPNSGNASLAVMCGVVWLLLRAAVRDKVWLEATDRKVLLRTGFAFFNVTYTTVDLSVALLDSATRAPVGAQAKGRTVYIAKRALDAVSDRLGGNEAATEWLRSAVEKVGLVPAGSRFVARG